MKLHATREGVGVERMVPLKKKKKMSKRENGNLINHPLPTAVVCPRDAHEDSRSVIR
jgi:hypothetical protein